MDFIFEHWELISVLLYELIARIWPTRWNVSLLDNIWKLVNLLVKNRRIIDGNERYGINSDGTKNIVSVYKDRHILKVIILFMLFSVTAEAQIWQNFKGVRLVNESDTTEQLSVEGSIYYDETDNVFYGRNNIGWKPFQIGAVTGNFWPLDGTSALLSNSQVNSGGFSFYYNGQFRVGAPGFYNQITSSDIRLTDGAVNYITIDQDGIEYSQLAQPLQIVTDETLEIASDNIVINADPLNYLSIIQGAFNSKLRANQLEGSGPFELVTVNGALTISSDADQMDINAFTALNLESITGDINLTTTDEIRFFATNLFSQQNGAQWDFGTARIRLGTAYIDQAQTATINGITNALATPNLGLSLYNVEGNVANPVPGELTIYGGLGYTGGNSDGGSVVITGGEGAGTGADGNVYISGSTPVTTGTAGGWVVIQNLPTVSPCATAPAGTIWANGGVLNVCP